MVAAEATEAPAAAEKTMDEAVETQKAVTVAAEATEAPAAKTARKRVSGAKGAAADGKE